MSSPFYFKYLDVDISRSILEYPWLHGIVIKKLLLLLLLLLLLVLVLFLLILFCKNYYYLFIFMYYINFFVYITWISYCKIFYSFCRYLQEMCVLNASLGPNSKMLRSSLKQCIDLAKSDITKLLNHKELAPGICIMWFLHWLCLPTSKFTLLLYVSFWNTTSLQWT